MTSKLSRAEVMALSPEARLAYNRTRNAERVARHRELNRESAMEYNRTYKKVYVNRPENKERYDELNRHYVNKHNAIKRDKKATALNTLTDAIRARKARAEMKKLKDEKEAKAEPAKRKRGRKPKNAN